MDGETPATDRQQPRPRWPWLLGGGCALAAVVIVSVVFVFGDDEDDQPERTARATSTTTASEADEEPAEAASTTTAPAAAAEPVELATGSFVSLDHTTSGYVRVLEQADGSRIVRLEGFETDDGPDLYVYLSTNPADGDEGAFDDDIVNLGNLQGITGDQDYELQADTDLGRYTTLVIWCDSFDSAFGAATLTGT